MFLILFSVTGSYESNGIKILITFPMVNVYVLVLQIMWRFSDKGKAAIESHTTQSISAVMLKAHKQKKGLDYFNEEYEVNVLKKGSIGSHSEAGREQNNSLITIEDKEEFQIKETKNKATKSLKKSDPTDKIDAKQEKINQIKLKKKFESIDKEFEVVTSPVKKALPRQESIADMIKSTKDKKKDHGSEIEIADEEDVSERDKIENESQLMFFSNQNIEVSQEKSEENLNKNKT
jgi:hypothetical protein